MPLPVELISFTSSTNNNSIILSWSTSSELNNAGFDIERSDNGSKQWNRVGFVAGNGTQTSVHNYTFTDNGVNTGRYIYRLKQTDINGNFQYHNMSGEVVIGIPQRYELSQNFPNPFNPVTKISYSIPTDGTVSIKLFDVRGRELSALVNEVHNAGYYTINFNAVNLTSGVYYYTLTAGSFNETKKMVILK